MKHCVSCLIYLTNRQHDCRVQAQGFVALKASSGDFFCNYFQPSASSVILIQSSYPIHMYHSRESFRTQIIGTSRNHDGNANENVYKFTILVLLSNYCNSFNLFNVAELSSKRTGGKGVQVETKNENFTVMCSRSPQNLEFGYFTLLFGRVLRRNVPKFITHVQGVCFSH